MKTKSFKYLGLTFTPVRNFTKSEQDTGIGLPFYSIGVSNYTTNPAMCKITNKWSWEGFYEVAKERNMVVDIYLLNHKAQVIPCQNELFAYGKSEAMKLKQS